MPFLEASRGQMEAASSRRGFFFSRLLLARTFALLMARVSQMPFALAALVLAGEAKK